MKPVHGSESYLLSSPHDVAQVQHIPIVCMPPQARFNFFLCHHKAGWRMLRASSETASGARDLRVERKIFPDVCISCFVVLVFDVSLADCRSLPPMCVCALCTCICICICTCTCICICICFWSASHTNTNINTNKTHTLHSNTNTTTPHTNTQKGRGKEKEKEKREREKRKKEEREKIMKGGRKDKEKEKRERERRKRKTDYSFQSQLQACLRRRTNIVLHYSRTLSRN